jgi:peptide/nickel transport system ATP-binding protein
MWTPESKGCPFAERCPKIMRKCREALPAALQIGEQHFARCFALEN